MSTIVTSEAKCRDCYKCVRHCPVKAIAIKDSQAHVVEENCLFCGRCVNVCPQKAKSTVSQISKLDDFLKAGEKVIVSLAPSYLAATEYSTPWKFTAALRQLGVDRIEETAVAAEAIAEQYARLFNSQGNSTIITSCCPVVVNLIEKYFPRLVGSLARLMSPMAAHARMIKKERGEDVRVVFVGPCFAKKAEPGLGDAEDALDAVITFEELLGYFSLNGIAPETLEDVYPDRISTHARTYPLRYGILKASGLEGIPYDDMPVISGVEECMETFKDMEEGHLSPRFVEAFGCAGGCIGGPAMANNLGISARQKRLLKFSREIDSAAKAQEVHMIPQVSLSREHSATPLDEAMPTEEEIRKILALTGKFSPEDEKNCGGCGYSTCREKAIAVYRGLAEPEMCVTHMREKAESLSNIVVDTSLNAIIVVDKDMVIQEFNQAANRMFNRKKIPPKGKHLSAFIDPTDFKKVWDEQKIMVNLRKQYEQYGLVTRQMLYPLPKYGVVIGVITDISSEEAQEQELANMRREALTRASKVIREQMRIAQEIAGLLGESTADTKATLLELIEIMERSEGKTG
ncbi:MAG: 4Fe-4S binding protein [Firmicutes bacterium]|nr:4Fe-4S binding protein [Bacillota bacterium]